MIPPKHFDIFIPLTEGSSEGLDTFRLSLKNMYAKVNTIYINFVCICIDFRESSVPTEIKISMMPPW